MFIALMQIYVKTNKTFCYLTQAVLIISLNLYNVKLFIYCLCINVSLINS